MRLRWLPSAAEDLREIHDFLYVNSYDVAYGIVNEIYDAILGLRLTPYIGRSDPSRNIRDLILARIRYKVTYRIHDDTIEVLHIRHTSRSARIN